MSEHIFCGCVQKINCKTFLTHYKSLSFSKDEENFLFFGFAREKSEREKIKWRRREVLECGKRYLAKKKRRRVVKDKLGEVRMCV
jgi:hypothetical protein